MSINSALHALYSKHWRAFIENGIAIRDPEPTNPLLLSFDDAAWERASMRVMICGQETWGWEAFGVLVREGMEGYNRFFVQKQFYPGYGKSAFWKAFRFYEHRLPEAFPKENLVFIYNNLNKIGRNDGKTGVSPEIRALEREFFPVFREEVELLQPDVVLFLSGPDRDHDIAFHFPDSDFKQAGDEPNLRRRARVVAPALPKASVRLYHPSYFRAWTHAYKEEAVDLVKGLVGQGR